MHEEGEFSHHGGEIMSEVKYSAQNFGLGESAVMLSCLTSHSAIYLKNLKLSEYLSGH